MFWECSENIRHEPGVCRFRKQIWMELIQVSKRIRCGSSKLNQNGRKWLAIRNGWRFDSHFASVCCGIQMSESVIIFDSHFDVGGKLIHILKTEEQWFQIRRSGDANGSWVSETLVRQKPFGFSILCFVFCRSFLNGFVCDRPNSFCFWIVKRKNWNAKIWAIFLGGSRVSESAPRNQRTSMIIWL